LNKLFQKSEKTKTKIEEKESKPEIKIDIKEIYSELLNEICETENHYDNQAELDKRINKIINENIRNDTRGLNIPVEIKNMILDILSNPNLILMPEILFELKIFLDNIVNKEKRENEKREKEEKLKKEKEEKEKKEKEEIEKKEKEEKEKLMNEENEIIVINEDMKFELKKWNLFVQTEIGCIWKLLKTKDGIFYFGNKTNKSSTWDVPQDFLNFLKNNK
jgi:hypothetical protein